MSRRIPILFIDKEGGWGGSSRSLYYLIQGLDRDKYAAKVWYKSVGPLSDKLAEIGIESRHVPSICSIIPRKSKNWKIWLVNAVKLLRLPELARQIKADESRIVHLNYEGLIPLLAVLRFVGCRKKIVVHFRTPSPPNYIYRVYAKIVNSSADYLIFITENEKSIASMAGIDLSLKAHRVLNNPLDREYFEERKIDKSYGQPVRLLFLGAIDWIKGADRLVDLAHEIRRRGINARIDAFGQSPRYKKFFVFRRNTLIALQRKVEREGLGDVIRFHGYTRDPLGELRKADLLIRPSRFNDPWGRDVLESLAVGVPIIATGDYDWFVRPGQTGYLMPQWDVSKCAEIIANLAADRDQLAGLSATARDLAKELLNPSRYAQVMDQIYSNLLAEIDGC